MSYNCQELVRVVPFFAEADDNFIRAVVTRLSFDVFLPGDYIIHCGAMGRNMYFIQQGIVDIITSDGNVAATLCDGAYFGGAFIITPYISLKFAYLKWCIYPCT